MIRTIPVTIAFFAFISAAACGQEPMSAEVAAEVKILRSRVDEFFRSLTTKSLGGPERAVRQIVDNGPLKERNDDISKLIEQALTLDQKYGPYTGHEEVQVKPVGSDLIFLRYLYKGEKFPVVWCFTFYRAAPIGGISRDWTLIALKFDAKVDTLER